MTKTELSKHEKAILLFFLKGTLSDLSKALLFFLIFYIMGIHIEFLCSLFFLILFRIFSGGIHCKTYLKCVLLSFVILSSGIILGIHIILPKPIAIMAGLVCGILTILYTPVLAPSRPALSIEQINQAKLHEGIVIIFFLILVVFQAPYINFGSWILVIHTIQLILSKKDRR